MDAIEESGELSYDVASMDREHKYRLSLDFTQMTAPKTRIRDLL